MVKWLEDCSPTRCCKIGDGVCDSEGLPVPAREEEFLDCVLGADPTYRAKCAGSAGDTYTEHFNSF